MLSNSIKLGTASLHQQLENEMLASKIMDGRFNFQDYIKVLAIHYLVHAELECTLLAALDKGTSLQLDFTSRRKLPAIEKDLHIAGQNVPHLVQYPFKTPKYTNNPEAMAGLYVLEGATLGGQIILKKLRKNVEFAQQKMHYYGIYQEATGLHWKNFLAVLNGQKISADILVAKAQETFDFYIQVAQWVHSRA